MATDFTVSADTSPAIAALDKLFSKLEQTKEKFNNAFEKMNAAAAALTATLVAAGYETMQFADEITDLAKANELTVGSVLALGEALAQNGGKADSAAKMLQTLSNNVDAANSGNLNLATTFGKLGVSISDLGNLSNQEIRDKLLDNIAKISDPLERNAKAVEIFGKSMIGVDVRKFAEDQKANREEMEKYSPALNTAGDAWDNLSKIAHESKIAFAQAFEPIFKFIAELNPSIESLTIKFKLMAAALAIVVSAGVIQGVLKLKDAFILLNAVVSKNPFVALAGAAIGLATYLGLTYGATDATKELNAEGEQNASTTEKRQRNQTGLNDAIKKERDALTQIRETLEKNWKLALDKYQVELDSLNLSEQDKKLAQDKAKIEEDAQNALFALKQKFDAMDTATRTRNAKTYEEEKKAIEDNAEAQKKAAEVSLNALEQRKRAIEDLTKSLSIFTSGTAEIAAGESKLATSLEGNINKRIGMEAQYNEMMKRRQLIVDQISKMSPEDQLKATQALNNATLATSDMIGQVDDLGRSFDEAFRKQVRGTGLSKNAFNSVTEGISAQNQALSETTELIIDSQRRISEQSRSFSTGWSQAFNSYVDNATNAASQAQRIFQNLTQGMEDMLFNFFKTGKLGWKNFIQNMVDTLLRSQIQQLMAKVMGGVGGASGGGSGGLLGLLGFADGGTIPTNGPVLVGERGPELISGAAGRTVTPNGSLGTSVVYNINAVDAMSFKQLLASDPSFLHAVAEQGRRRLPGAR